MKANKRVLILGLISVSSLFSCGKSGSGLSSSASSSPSSLGSSSSDSSSFQDNPMKKYGLSLQWKEGFRILWLTDIHLGNPTNTAVYDEAKEYAHLRTMIEKADNPDLIVFT